MNTSTNFFLYEIRYKMFMILKWSVINEISKLHLQTLVSEYSLHLQLIRNLTLMPTGGQTDIIIWMALEISHLLQNYIHAETTILLTASLLRASSKSLKRLSSFCFSLRILFCLMISFSCLACNNCTAILLSCCDCRINLFTNISSRCAS